MAGFFGFFDYTKPGKGISKDEPQKTRFAFFWELFFRKFWRLIQLNLLYIAFCLPIVTIGPATAGFTYVLRNMSTEQPVFLFSDFWDALKNNLKQSFIYSVLLVVGSILLGVSWRFYWANIETSSLFYIPLVICLMMGFLLINMSFYIMLMIVTLDLPLLAIFKNAALLSIICLKTNLITLFFVALIVFATYLFPIAWFFVIFLTPALIGFIICYNSYPGIKKYAIDPFIEAQKAGQEEAAEEPVIFDDDLDARKNKS